MARKRDYRAEYAARKARGAGKGESASAAAGHRDRDYRREYRERIVREVAAGRRKPPRAQPRNKRSPTGAVIGGAHRWDGPDACQPAGRYVNRLRSDRRVFLYARVDINGAEHNLQLFPNGGIRAGTLRQLIRDAGDLEALFLAEIGAGDRLADDSDPTINPQNRKGRSPKLRNDEEQELEVEFIYVVVQWSA